MANKPMTPAQVKAANAAKRKASLAVLNKHVTKKKAVEAAITKAAKDPRMKSGLPKGGGNKGGASGTAARRAANKATAYNPVNKAKKRR